MTLAEGLCTRDVIGDSTVNQAETTGYEWVNKVT